MRERARGRPLTDATRAAVIADVKATHGTPEGTARKVATRQGVSPTTVRKIANELGLTAADGRAQIENATAATVASLAHRRTELAKAQLALAEEATAYARLAISGKVRAHLDSNDFARGLMPTAQQAAVISGIAVDKHKVLDMYDSDASTGTAVDAWLRGLTAGGNG